MCYGSIFNCSTSITCFIANFILVFRHYHSLLMYGQCSDLDCNTPETHETGKANKNVSD